MGISLVLAPRYGVAGVLLGTLISFLVFSFWTKPYFVYRDVFCVPFRKYVCWEGQKIILSILIALATWYVVSLVSLTNMFLNFCVKAVVALAMSNGLLLVGYHKSEEFEYIRMLVDTFVARFRNNREESLDD